MLTTITSCGSSLHRLSIDRRISVVYVANSVLSVNVGDVRMRVGGYHSSADTEQTHPGRNVSTIFISHSDSAAAIVLERTLRNAFPGEVTVFNTSRASSGLAAGDAIDTQVVERIAEADVIVWLASPLSVRKSFWMAWELGVATALKRTVIPVRCFGLVPDDLPLLQGGRMAPDIGERDGMLSLLTTVQRQLGLDGNLIAEALDHLHGRDHPSPLWGITRRDAISLQLLGSRLLVENHQTEDIVFRRLAVLARDGEPGVDLLRELPKLAASGRHILDAQSVDLSQREVELEWFTEGGARYWAREVVVGSRGDASTVGGDRA